MKRHLHTRFVNFLIERHQEFPVSPEESEINWEELPEDIDDEDPRRESEDEPEESDQAIAEDEVDSGIDDEEVIDQLLMEYRKTKKTYEKLVGNRRRRKAL